MVTKKASLDIALCSTEYSCHPVIRCKKCDNDSDTSDCCMIYVDETGRVYQNWDSYIKENVLPAGTMITPRRGVYNFDKNGRVILDAYCTPNGSDDARFMEVAQTSSSVLGLGAACVPVVGLVLPVAAPVMAAAGFIGLGVGAFTAVASALNLSDRKKHGQSLSFGNREARANYIGVFGGAVGMAAAGATRVMTSMASAGKATKGIEVLVNGLSISSIAVSGTGAAQGVLDLIFKFNDGEKISKMDILQLSASLVLFTHSVYNFQLASKIANNARNSSIKSYRETLSNRQRKMFDKMSKETIRIRGATQGRMDIIRGVNEVPVRQYLNDLFKVNKNLHKQNIRPSFGASGEGILLNNEIQVNAAELRQSIQHQRGPDILKQVTQPIPSTHNSEVYTTQVPKDVKLYFVNGNVGHSVDVNLDENKWQSALFDMKLKLGNGAVIMFNTFGKDFLLCVHDISKFEDIVSTLFEKMTQSAAEFILKLSQTFVEKQKYEIECIIKASIATESVIYQIMVWVLNKCYNASLEYLSKSAGDILKGIREHFLTLNTKDPYGIKKNCPNCQGWTTLSQL